MAPFKQKNTLQEEHNGFGPIFVVRGNKARHMSWLVLLAFVVIPGVWLYSRENKKQKSFKKWYFYLISLLLLVVAAILGEVIRRFCLFYEEYHHIDKRYLGKKKDAFMACFYQKNINFVIVVGAFCLGFACILSAQDEDKHAAFDSKHLQIVIMGVVFIPLVSFLLDLRSPTAAERSQLNEAESNNVADGLAWSYYFGYLKLILPNLHDTINATEVKIDNAHFRDIVAENPTTSKLFIVLPKDCYCYESFDKMDNRITHVDNTKPLEIDRAGVARRVYKNTIYKVSAQGKEFYCLMEYATPLQSMYDMYDKLKHDSNKPDFDRNEIDQQVVQFVKKLRNILEADPECRDKYCLITVRDAHHNLADVMVDEIMNPKIFLSDA